MPEVYLDNSATTKVCRESAEKIMEILTDKYGNPSSLHSKGLEAEKELRMARSIIADYIGCESREVYFTSGGTESNNLAIFGAAKALKRRGNKIITTAIEHPSVLASVEELSKQGLKTVFIKPDKYGFIDETDLYNAIDEKTILVSMMLVNNEVGTIQNVQNIKKIAQRKKCDALIHVDAVQAFGKIPIKVSKLGVDLLTVTAHKIHGPKGVGALYVSKKARILPTFFGGLQENTLRPGTEAIPLICGFGAAVSATPDLKDEYEIIKELRDYTKNKLSEIDGIVINSPLAALPYIINFSVPGIRSETMLHFLASNDIYVSSGSACSKGKKSHVLESMELDKNLIDSAIRVSFSRYNSKNDIDILIDSIKIGIKNLAKRGKQ